MGYGKIVRLSTAWFYSRDGATAIEYGIIAGGIALAIITAVFAFGGDLRNVYTAIGTSMTAAAARMGS